MSYFNDLMVSSERGDLPSLLNAINEAKNNLRNNLTNDLEIALIKACEFGSLNIVKYLIETKDLEERLKISCHNWNGLNIAAKKNRLNIIEYFIDKKLVPKEIKEKIFYWAFYNGLEDKIVSYLIFKTDLDFSEEIKQLLNEKDINRVELLFLKKNLDNKLKNNKNNNKKTKI